MQWFMYYTCLDGLNHLSHKEIIWNWLFYIDVTGSRWLIQVPRCGVSLPALLTIYMLTSVTLKKKKKIIISGSLSICTWLFLSHFKTEKIKWEGSQEDLRGSIWSTYKLRINGLVKTDSCWCDYSQHHFFSVRMVNKPNLLPMFQHPL